MWADNGRPPTASFDEGVICGPSLVVVLGVQDESIGIWMTGISERGDARFKLFQKLWKSRAPLWDHDVMDNPLLWANITMEKIGHQCRI